MAGYDDEYVPLGDAIREVLTPAILGQKILEREHDLVALEVNVGGLALSDPVKSAQTAYQASAAATRILQHAV